MFLKVKKNLTGPQGEFPVEKIVDMKEGKYQYSQKWKAVLTIFTELEISVRWNPQSSNIFQKLLFTEMFAFLTLF